MRWLALLAALAACAPQPLTPERAESICRAELARDDGVRGGIGIGIGSGGPRVRTGIVIDDRVLDRRSPREKLQGCIARRVAGQAPPPRVGITLGTDL